MNRIVKAMALIALLMVSIGTVSAVPEGSSADVVLDTSGDYIEIGTAEELQALAALVNGGEGLVGKDVYLTNDVDLNGISNWTPIGTGDNPFRGSFYGSGYRITNLTIDSSGSGNSDVYLGLFGSVEGDPNQNYQTSSQVFDVETGVFNPNSVAQSDYSSVIMDLYLTDVSVKADGSKVGALVGQITNVYVCGVHVTSGTIEGTNSVGGIVGRGYGSVMSGCTTGEYLIVGSGENTTGNVYNFGGIIGSMRVYENADKTVTTYGLIDGCENNADVTAYLSGGGMGGIVGQAPGTMLVIHGCINHGTITIKGSGTQTAISGPVAGGISGQFQGTKTENGAIIADCANHGLVTSTSTNNVAALSGITNYYHGTIYGCSNTGEITGNARAVGGIVGHGNFVDIIGSTNSGKVGTTMTEGVSSTICASSHEVKYKDMTFATVQELGDALIQTGYKTDDSTKNGVKLVLENVAVTNGNGVLNVPLHLTSLQSDLPVCTEIRIGGSEVDFTAYTGTVSVPDADIVIEGCYRLVVGSDGNTITNSGTMTSLVVNGNGAVVYNDGSLGGLEFHGKDITLNNGASADMKSVFSRGTGSIVINNYGKIERGDGLHALTMGVQPASQPTEIDPVNDVTVKVHNYGSIIGGTSGYIMIVQGAASVDVYNYKDSKMQTQTTTYFIYRGHDGYTSTADGYTWDQGTFTFNYADGTVLAKDGAAVADVTTNMFVGYDSGKDMDSKIVINKLVDEDVYVTYTDGTVNEKFLVVDKKVTGVPVWTKAGFTLSGWEYGGDAWDPATAVESDITVTAVWTLQDPSVAITVTESSGTITLTASVTNSGSGITYGYAWTLGGEPFGDSTTVNVIDSGVYAVTVTATYDGTDTEGSANYTYSAPPVVIDEPVTVTIGGVDHGYDNIQEAIYAMTAGAELRFNEDVSVDSLIIPYAASGSIDLNGQTLTVTGAISVGGGVTISDGTIAGNLDVSGGIVLSNVAVVGDARMYVDSDMFIRDCRFDGSITIDSSTSLSTYTLGAVSGVYIYDSVFAKGLVINTASDRYYFIDGGSFGIYYGNASLVLGGDGVLAVSDGVFEGTVMFGDGTNSPFTGELVVTGGTIAGTMYPTKDLPTPIGGDYTSKDTGTSGYVTYTVSDHLETYKYESVPAYDDGGVQDDDDIVKWYQQQAEAQRKAEEQKQTTYVAIAAGAVAALMILAFAAVRLGRL